MSSRLLVVRVHGTTSIVVTTGVSGAFVPRLTDLGEQPRSPPVLYVDNKAMLALCREHRLEHRTKHIALRYFLSRELQQRGQLRLAYVASEANTADIFTKALAPGDHQRFCTLLAMAIAATASKSCISHRSLAGSPSALPCSSDAPTTVKAGVRATAAIVAPTSGVSRLSWLSSQPPAGRLVRDVRRWKRAGASRATRGPASNNVVALFTGIVEEMGAVRQLQQGEDGGWQMTVEASTVLTDVHLGDSIAVNGTCLTVTTFDSSSFVVGLAPETLRRTNLGDLKEGSPVNLERSLRADSRLGGHFVQGHVDGTGVIKNKRPEGDSLWLTVQCDPSLLKYIVPKGYIAVDGTSLTVVEVNDEESWFTFMLVAYTQQKIVVPGKQIGDRVNLEVDIVGKYVERVIAPAYKYSQ
ncbi:unnamed protein product [Closterium sp. NIES-53]